MIKPILLFAATFAGGALVTLAVRSALHQPYPGPSAQTESPAYAAQVHNVSPPHPTTAPPHPPPAAPLHLPTAAPSSPPTANPAEHDHDHADPLPRRTVNSVCPICGMDVDPSLPPAEYQGQLVGFGCRACPPRFSRDPDRYGPSALKNEVLKN